MKTTDIIRRAMIRNFSASMAIKYQFVLRHQFLACRDANYNHNCPHQRNNVRVCCFSRLDLRAYENIGEYARYPILRDKKCS